MDTSATLTAKEAVAWSDPERPLPEAHGCYNAVTSTGVENRDICVAFDEAFRLKKMLDSLEDSRASV